MLELQPPPKHIKDQREREAENAALRVSFSVSLAHSLLSSILYLVTMETLAAVVS